MAKKKNTNCSLFQKMCNTSSTATDKNRKEKFKSLRKYTLAFVPLTNNFIAKGLNVAFFSLNILYTFQISCLTNYIG